LWRPTTSMSLMEPHAPKHSKCTKSWTLLGDDAMARAIWFAPVWFACVGRLGMVATGWRGYDRSFVGCLRGRCRCYAGRVPTPQRNIEDACRPIISMWNGDWFLLVVGVWWWMDLSMEFQGSRGVVLVVSLCFVWSCRHDSLLMSWLGRAFFIAPSFILLLL
jgi:hypothetical protein